jgi:hypothetical protein
MNRKCDNRLDRKHQFYEKLTVSRALLPIKRMRSGSAITQFQAAKQASAISPPSASLSGSELWQLVNEVRHNSNEDHDKPTGTSGNG